MGVTKSHRLANFTVDIAIIFIVSILFSSLISSPEYITINLSVVLFLYYFIFELIKGQTPGKMLTGTKVVNNSGEKPSLKKILIRTLVRFYPFDPTSYLFGSEQGAHDLFSKTKLTTK